MKNIMQHGTPTWGSKAKYLFRIHVQFNLILPFLIQSVSICTYCKLTMIWKLPISHTPLSYPITHIDELVQEIRNPFALAMELRLSCTKPSIWPCPLYIIAGEFSVPIEAIFEMILSNAFTKIGFWYIFHYNMFTRFHSTLCHRRFRWCLTIICLQGFNQHYSFIGPDNGLASNKRQAIIFTLAGLVYWGNDTSLHIKKLSWFLRGCDKWKIFDIR